MCPLSAIAFGFRKPNDAYLKGFAAVGMYCEDEGGTKLEAKPGSSAGKYDYVCIAPIARANFKPDVRGIRQQRAGDADGECGALQTRRQNRKHTGGRLDCAEIVIQTVVTGEPKVVLPCNSDRVFGMAQDTEMVFTMPWNRPTKFSKASRARKGRGAISDPGGDARHGDAAEALPGSPRDAEEGRSVRLMSRYPRQPRVSSLTKARCHRMAPDARRRASRHHLRAPSGHEAR